MAALTVASMSLLKPSRCLGITNHHTHDTCQKVLNPSSLLKLQDLTKSFVISKARNLPAEGMATAMACAVLSSLSCCNAAVAAQQIADVAEGGNRGLLLVAPIIPAILWALYNIFEPAINQINRMRDR
ncbi:Photosystem II core complex proteins psbY chloroplastic [Euphorbia peplus]|nr:Photosystem II core complex proteins psbY chloroplastic [Euphorbia peplus]